MRDPGRGGTGRLRPDTASSPWVLAPAGWVAPS
jgi:hypothetical protein